MFVFLCPATFLLPTFLLTGSGDYPSLQVFRQVNKKKNTSKKGREGIGLTCLIFLEFYKDAPALSRLKHSPPPHPTKFLFNPEFSFPLPMVKLQKMELMLAAFTFIFHNLLNPSGYLLPWLVHWPWPCNIPRGSLNCNPFPLFGLTSTSFQATIVSWLDYFSTFLSGLPSPIFYLILSNPLSSLLPKGSPKSPQYSQDVWIPLPGLWSHLNSATAHCLPVPSHIWSLSHIGLFVIFLTSSAVSFLRIFAWSSSPVRKSPPFARLIPAHLPSISVDFLGSGKPFLSPWV